MDDADRADKYAAFVRQVSIRNSQTNLEVGAQGLSHCEECGEEIPERRRELFPNTRLCVACKSEIEARQKPISW